MTTKSATTNLDLHKIQQTVKWIVYAILLVNFIGYLIDDLEFAQYGLQDGESLLRWTTTFAATIDELAWFMLLFLFELETYALSDEAFEGVFGKLIHGVQHPASGFNRPGLRRSSGRILPRSSCGDEA
jgi:hypothetical protein